MANTEINNTLRIVHSAKKDVLNIKLEIDDPKERSKADELYTLLDSLYETLLMKEIEKNLEELNIAGIEIQKVNEYIEEKTEKLKEVSDKVGKVATALKCLVAIIENSIKLGLL